MSSQKSKSTESNKVVLTYFFRIRGSIQGSLDRLENISIIIIHVRLDAWRGEGRIIQSRWGECGLGAGD